MFGASGVFAELQSALNKIWNVQPRESNIASLIKAHSFAFGMVLAVGFLLLVSLVVSAALAALGKFTSEILPLPEFVMMATMNFIVSFAGVSLLFALLFKYVSDAKIRWQDVWEGGDRDRPALHHWEISDRDLSGESCGWFGVRRRRVAHRDRPMGLLFCDDFPFRRGVYARTRSQPAHKESKLSPEW